MPLGLAVEGANRHDSMRVEATVQSIPSARPEPTAKQLQNLCLDKGYDDERVRDLVQELDYTAPLKAWGAEAQALKRQAGFQARRGVVERTHRWLNRFRRRLTRWEKKAENYLALRPLVGGSITYHCAGLFG